MNKRVWNSLPAKIAERWAGVLLLATGVCLSSCSGAPTAPTPSAVSLELRAVDDATNQPIVDPAYAITAHLAGPAMYSDAVRNGVALFSAMQPGTYSLTTDIPFGYIQLDVLNIVLDGPRSLVLRLRRVADDVGVVEVSVDGQGSILKGSTVEIPRQGVNLRLRGNYKSATSPWPAQNQVFVDTLDANFAAFGVDESPNHKGGLIGPADWELAFINWRPCSNSLSSQLSCSAASGGFHVRLYRPGTGDALRIKVQAWPLSFRLASDCCSVMPW